MLRFGYLDNREQIEQFTKNDEVESSKSIVKKMWMNTKRKYSATDIARSTNRIVEAIYEFNPDLIFLGDDNATNYIGNEFIDTEIPVVFWGVNGSPLKYSLIDSMEEPGHNITGVWQSGYIRESLDLLHQLVPSAETFGIVACDSPTSRPKIKELRALDRERKLKLKLVDQVVTNSYEDFKDKTLKLAKKVDALFVMNHDTLKDRNGKHIDMMKVGRWYLRNVKKPEASHEGQFVKEGMLCTANDSGYNQSYEAFLMAFSILERGSEPRLMAPRTPQRGPLMVNRQRAKMLKISLKDKSELIEEIVEKALALEK